VVSTVAVDTAADIGMLHRAAEFSVTALGINILELKIYKFWGMCC